MGRIAGEIAEKAAAVGLLVQLGVELGGPDRLARDAERLVGVELAGGQMEDPLRESGGAILAAHLSGEFGR